MTEAEARARLLLRTFDPSAASDADADPALAPRRAARLAEREPAAAAALRAATWPRGAAAGLVAAAFAAGLALDSLGPAGRIHLLSAPLALLAWNVAVYALLALHALRALARREPASAAVPGPLRTALSGAVRRLAAARGGGRPGETARFLAGWAALAAPLHGARVARLLHLAAAALAAGLLASLYLRGLFLEYRAGWDSTFLTPEAVHRLLSVVLWPALQLTGASLPGPDALAPLRFSAGGGENAARWIHWIALTVVTVVVLPRALLAAAAGWRATRLARDFPWPAAAAGPEAPAPTSVATAARTVRVLPYSYRPPEGCEAALREALERRLGAPVALRLEPPVPLGGEDAPEGWRRPDATGTLAVPLFALTATPERETHGAFLAALFAGDAAPRVLLVDESGFRRRFDGAQGEARLAERRAAWQRLADAADAVPWFEDLAATAAPDAAGRAAAAAGGGAREPAGSPGDPARAADVPGDAAGAEPRR